MKKEIGLWIDHRKTVIVILTSEGEEIRQISSNMEKHIRFSGAAESSVGGAEDMRDRRFTNHLGTYYEGVISSIRDADAILIMGPGEAKVEIKTRLESEGLGGRIAGIESVDKMTDHQIAAKVRQHFAK